MTRFKINGKGIDIELDCEKSINYVRLVEIMKSKEPFTLEPIDNKKLIIPFGVYNECIIEITDL